MVRELTEGPTFLGLVDPSPTRLTGGPSETVLLGGANMPTRLTGGASETALLAGVNMPTRLSGDQRLALLAEWVPSGSSTGLYPSDTVFPGSDIFPGS